jgi:predicted phage terminase large subunit-like protein
MQDCEFEANMGGDRVGEEVDKRVSSKGWICNITAKATESNKEARIFQCSNWILQHVIFKDTSLYSAKDQYGVMMSQLLSYSVSGKNPHDDVPDTFSNFALKIKNKDRVQKTVIMKSPI